MQAAHHMRTAPQYNPPVEIIKDKLYWVSDVRYPDFRFETVYFNMEIDMEYNVMFEKMGPPDVKMIYNYIVRLIKKLRNDRNQSKIICHYSDMEPVKRSNACFLMCAYMMIVMGKSALEAWSYFEHLPKFANFNGDDVHPAYSNDITIMFCLRGLERAIRDSWFNIQKFNLQKYEHCSSFENGNVSELVSGKLLTFSNPGIYHIKNDGMMTFTPEDVVPIFKSYGVTLIIRLSPPDYDCNRFVRYGFRFIDFTISDAHSPSEQQVFDFVNLVRGEAGAVAVHCKTGLGNSCMMCGCYAMIEHRWTAEQVIAWFRIMRPGCLTGLNQQFLIRKEKYFLKPQSTVTESSQYYHLGHNFSRMHSNPSPKSTTHGKSRGVSLPPVKSRAERNRSLTHNLLNETLLKKPKLDTSFNLR